MSQQNTLSPPAQRESTAGDSPHETGFAAVQCNGDITANHSRDFRHNGSTADDANHEVMPAANSLQLWQRGIDWPVVVWIGLVHMLAIVAPFYFSWQALVACAVLIIVTGALGVCMGYHRCLTHGSFKTYRPVRWFLAFLGGLSGEG